jgi:hypothetical protein
VLEGKKSLLTLASVMASLNIDDEILIKSALHFFRRIGRILYFDTSNEIVSEPMFLLDSLLRPLIQCGALRSTLEEKKFLRRIQNCGVTADDIRAGRCTRSALALLWSTAESPVTTDSPKFQSYIRLLENLNFLFSPSEDRILIPSLLPETKDSKEEVWEPFPNPLRFFLNLTFLSCHLFNYCHESCQHKFSQSS